MNKHVTCAMRLRRNVLALALVAGLGLTGSAFGQATTGTIFGQAPVADGETITIRSDSGLTRQVAVDTQGRYSLDSLPLGNYTVTLSRNGSVVDTRTGVTLRVGSGTEVSFASANADGVSELERVEVKASRPPAIDVSGVDSRTVITSEQLARLPIARSAEAIAMLAPGVVAGSDFFTGPTGGQVISMGGSSVTENAYYINGFNTTDPLSGFGGFALPYGSIDQQEILNGGYGAPYGRSDGGVISQIGKRGTNTWKFGGQVEWTPTFLRGDQRDVYYVSGAKAGTLQNRNADDKSWTRVASAYAGGPLLADRLFVFASIESERRQGSSIGSVTANDKTQYRNDYPKWYAKLDWNINDSNTLELTSAYTERSYASDIYDYDYVTGQEGALNSHGTSTKTSAEVYSAKFTSYLTDNLTVSAMYGQMHGTYSNEHIGYDATHAFVYGPQQQNPLYTGGNSIEGPQKVSVINDPTHTTKSTNLRIDVNYRLGSHTLAAGIDNQIIDDINDRNYISGPGYAWEYDRGAAGTPIIGVLPSDDPYVDAPGNYAGGAGGYFVARYARSGGGSVRVEQRAQYLEDTWQVNNNWLLKVGLRNDQFINYNPDGQAYLRLTKPQWAPRLGFSWDVNGDASFKVYGNVGRYYLALPATVAMRQAGNPLYTREYFTYTGIDSNGVPTGLSPIANSRNGPISANGEYGQSKDPHSVAATNLESEHQDEMILGFDKKLGESWVFGAKAIYRDLRTAIDDYGDSGAIIDKLDKLGIDPGTYDKGEILGAYLFNPGKNTKLNIKMKDGSYYLLTMTPTEMFGFPARYKRSYYGLDLYLEHPFDGKWFGKIDYLHSRSYGNSEGQVRSDIGQTDVSATVDWDYGQVMEYANGDLSNSVRHQIKAYGSYQLNPELTLSGNMAILSGAPRSCLGMYGPDQTNPGLGYGSYYHWCDGKPSRPGDAGHNPWQYIFSMSAEYRPAWADKKLGFSVMVYNIFNNRETTQTDARSGSFSGGIPSRVDYLRATSQSTPRYVRFGISYDF